MFDIVCIRSHAHKSAYPDIAELFPFIACKHLPAFVETETEFGLFLCYVQLKQAVYGSSGLGCLPVDFGKEFVGIHSMNQSNIGYDIFDFIRLQMSDEMPFDIFWKVADLPKDIEWHFIGHLQTNKVKYIAPYISMIEAVDSLKLLKEINKQAAKHDRVVKVLLELHIAAEETKYGLTLDACRALLEEGEWRSMEHVQICGLMMMASNTDDTEQIAREFDTAARFFDEVKAKYFAGDDAFCECSWGMSHDYPIAIQHGATLVRVGTAIFGPRIY